MLIYCRLLRLCFFKKYVSLSVNCYTVNFAKHLSALSAAKHVSTAFEQFKQIFFSRIFDSNCTRVVLFKASLFKHMLAQC